MLGRQRICLCLHCAWALCVCVCVCVITLAVGEAIGAVCTAVTPQSHHVGHTHTLSSHLVTAGVAGALCRTLAGWNKHIINSSYSSISYIDLVIIWAFKTRCLGVSVISSTCVDPRANRWNNFLRGIKASETSTFWLKKKPGRSLRHQ